MEEEPCQVFEEQIMTPTAESLFFLLFHIACPDM
jgi:hypothetical protein